MDMNAFFCIVLSILVIRWWLKNRPQKSKPRVKPEPSRITAVNETVDKVLVEKKKADRQRERDIAELRKQGYTDELIATILPVVEGD